MKAIYTLLILLIPFVGFGQNWSTYYLDANINSNINANINKNINANINKNINVSGNVNKTITTIDYGALAQANAQREHNKLLRLQYSNEIEKKQAIEIAADPMKAHSYGTPYTNKVNSSNLKWLKYNAGFVSYSDIFVIPHKSLFENVGAGRWENISSDGITTEFMVYAPNYNYLNLPILSYEDGKKYSSRIEILKSYYENNEKPNKKDYFKKYDEYKTDLERYYEICDSLDNCNPKGSYYNKSPIEYSKQYNRNENEKFFNLTDSAYLHKKYAVKRMVYSVPGFKYTRVWEDEYEICITDCYISQKDDILYFAVANYKADKNSNITFEDLEGRRFYLNKFIDKHIASRRLGKYNVQSTKSSTLPKRRNYSSYSEYRIAFDKWKKNNL